MLIIGFSLALVLAFLLVHVLIWRLFPDRRSIGVLVGLSLAVLILGVTFWEIISARCNLGEALLMVQFHIFATLAYIVGYSGVEEESPSLMILKLASRAGSRGIAKSEIEDLINNNFILERRLGPMKTAGLIIQEGESLILSPKGQILSSAFSIFRSISNTDLGR
jgi:hypothetical protein